MRILYLCNAQIPSRSTNALQVMRMCAGFRRAGADVTLVHPRRLGNRPEGYDGDVWGFYGVAERFRIISLPTPLTRSLSKLRLLARPLEGAPLAAYLAYLARPGAPPFVAYARSFLGAWLLLQIRRRLGQRSSCRGVFVELHDEPRTDREWSVVRAADGVVAISSALHDQLIEQAPEIADRSWVEHDGVDLRLFDSRTLDRAQARRRLGMAEGRRVAVYTGRVNREKGAGVLLEAAALLPDHNVVLVGRVYDVGHGEKLPANVTLTGYVPPADVPQYVAAADALVLPSTNDLPYARYTSPLKLFEYMASRRPIVAADLPVFREVLTPHRSALVYPPSDSRALAACLERLDDDPALAHRLADAALRDVQSYGWDLRGSRILAQVRHLFPPGSSARGLNQNG